MTEQITVVNRTAKEIEAELNALDVEFKTVLVNLGDLLARLDPMLESKKLLLSQREQMLQHAGRLNKELQGAKALETPNA